MNDAALVPISVNFFAPCTVLGQYLEVPGHKFLLAMPVSLVEGKETGSRRHVASPLILCTEEELSTLIQTRDQFSLELLPRELDQGRDSGRP